jgi:DNA-binding NtrC family response regulator
MTINGRNGLVGNSAPCVAVIDDDPTMRDVMHEILLDGGYDIVLWDGVEDPFTLIQRVQPDVMILDIRLGPSLTIWSVLERLSVLPLARRPQTIVCSADTQFLREHGDPLREQSCEIVEKPFDIDDLLNAVASCLAVSRR